MNQVVTHNTFFNHKFDKHKLESLGFQFAIQTPPKFSSLFGTPSLNFKERKTHILKANILDYKIWGFWISETPIQILRGFLNFYKVGHTYIYLLKFQDSIIHQNQTFKLECWGWNAKSKLD